MKRVFSFIKRNIGRFFICVILSIMFFIMGLLAKNLSEVTHISSDSWLAFIGTIVGSLAGAYFGANFAYNVTKRQDKQKLRKDLEIQTADKLLEYIRIFNDNSSKMLFQDFTSFSAYNMQIEIIHNNKKEDINFVIRDINLKQIKTAKERIINTMDLYFELWKTYSNSFLSIINILESKEVILNKFQVFKDPLITNFELIMKLNSDIEDIYYKKICLSTANSEKIDDKYLIQLQDYDNKFLEKKIEIQAITWDLRIGLQNEFLSDIFDYKVPLRQPTDKNIKVYVPASKYKKYL